MSPVLQKTPLPHYEKMSDILIQAGLKVLIKRNDGRTHHAIISNVNHKTNSVAVEWFEAGETKGKEVDFDTLIVLNPHLTFQPPEDVIKEDPSSSKSFKRDGRKRSCGSVQSRSQSATERANLSRAGRVNDSDVSVGDRGRKLPKTASSLSLDKFPVDSGSVEPVKKIVFKAALPVPNILKPKSPTAEDNPASTAAKPKRKSSTVREIEKLQKNRELRRLKQAEKKEEREALLTTHSGNPNWQFQAMIKDYQEKMDFKPLTDSDEATEYHQITVCVRKRPLNKKETLAKEVDVISVPRKSLVVVHEPKNKVDLTKYLENQQFRFDYIFDEMCNNETVYNFTAKPLVETIFDGGMATCFAYGQTGSGKTHTMSGAARGAEKGIYAMVAIDVFKCLTSPEHVAKGLTVSSSYYEIYGGKVFDLLAKNARLRVLEDGKQQVQIVGLTEKVVRSVVEVLALIDVGNNARTSGRTSANSCSSRSHAIFQITLRQGTNQKIYGRIHLIDLAGNERGADTSSASRVTRLEGAEINKSLLALKECIRALGRKDSHLPFRGSTLTLVLRDSFIGDKTKTCMIAMISPGLSSCEHTLNTLRYADRVKELGYSEVLPDVQDRVNSEWVANKPESDSEEDNSLVSKLPCNSAKTTTNLTKSNKMQLLEKQMVGEYRNWLELCPKFDANESQLLLERAINILQRPNPSSEENPGRLPPKREADSEEDSIGLRNNGQANSDRESNKLHRLELQMLRAFQLWTQVCPKFNQEESQLLLEAHGLQYDPIRFTNQLDRMLGERHQFLSKLRDRVTAFRLQLSDECNKLST